MSVALATSTLPAERAQAQKTFAKNSKSFRFAAAFLSKTTADNAALVYQFCRKVDDLADDATCVATAERHLQDVLEQCTTGQARSPEVVGFLETSSRCGIPLEAAEVLVEGVLFDLQPVRIKSKSELCWYAYRVAGVVGRMMCPVLGVKDRRAIEFAVDLGLAMQITNICRDVKEDAQLGRVYVPTDLLGTYGLEADDILVGRYTRSQIAAVIDELLKLAESLYDRSMLGMRFIPFRSRLAILMARRIYREIGRKLQREHSSDPSHGRTVVGWFGKCSQAFLAFFDAIRPSVLGLVEKEIPDHPVVRHWKVLTDSRQSLTSDEHRAKEVVYG